MAPPKPKSKQQAMPSMLKSMQRSVTVASAAVDNAFAPSSTGGVGQRSSAAAAAAAAQERHSLLANDGMSDHHPAAQASSPDRVGGLGGMGDLSGGAGGVGGGGAPKAPKLMKMSSRHIKMKKMMDNITTRLKLHSRGDNIAFGRRDRGDASGKSYNVEIPKNMIVLIMIGFFLAPLAFGLWVLFRQLFMSEEVHSRYQHHSSGSGGKHPAAYHITKNGEFSNATVASALNATRTGIDGIDQVLTNEGASSPAVKLPEVSSEAGDNSVGDHEDDKIKNTVADEKDKDKEGNESAAAKGDNGANGASSKEKGTLSQTRVDADVSSKVTKGNVDEDPESANADSDEKAAKNDTDDDEDESMADKDDSEEVADANAKEEASPDDAGDAKTIQADGKAKGDLQESKEDLEEEEDVETNAGTEQRIKEKGGAR